MEKQFGALTIFKTQVMGCWSCKVSIIGASKESQQRKSDREWRNTKENRHTDKFFSQGNSHHHQWFNVRFGQQFSGISTHPCALPSTQISDAVCVRVCVCVYSVNKFTSALTTVHPLIHWWIKDLCSPSLCSHTHIQQQHPLIGQMATTGHLQSAKSLCHKLPVFTH